MTWPPYNAYDEITEKLHIAFETYHLSWELQQEQQYGQFYIGQNFNAIPTHGDYTSVLNVRVTYFDQMPEGVVRRIKSHFYNLKHGALRNVQMHENPIINYREWTYHFEFIVREDIVTFVNELVHGAREAFDREFHRLLEDEICS